MAASTLKNRNLLRFQFFCPKCSGKRPYRVRSLTANVLFYYLPLFENNHLDFLIECQCCKRSFDPRILTHQSQTLFKLAVVAKDEIRRGVSPKELRTQLVKEGLKEDFADQLIALAAV